MKNKLCEFRTSMKLGIISNALFILFLITCLIYYEIYGSGGLGENAFEIGALCIEGLGFIFMVLSILGLVFSLRQRMLMKISMSIYLVTEVVIMLFDFQFITIGDFYDGYSHIFIIIHSIFSAFVCMTYFSLDKKKLPVQIVVTIASVIMLAGMFSIVYGIRVYASVFVNAVAYLFLDIALLIQNKLEILEVDCYGDKARVQEYKSSFFD